MQSDENYTPPDFIDFWRDWLGGFDLDPFSCELANQTVKAEKYFTKDDNALLMDWTGYKRKWCNPPYSRQLIKPSVEKILLHAHEGETLVLVNSSTSAKWFHMLLNEAQDCVFLNKRLQFNSPFREASKNGNLYDQTLFYFGDRSLPRNPWGTVCHLVN